jgi:hypothetical protein
MCGSERLRGSKAGLARGLPSRLTQNNSGNVLRHLGQLARAVVDRLRVSATIFSERARPGCQRHPTRTALTEGGMALGQNALVARHGDQA